MRRRYIPCAAAVDHSIDGAVPERVQVRDALEHTPPRLQRSVVPPSAQASAPGAHPGEQLSPHRRPRHATSGEGRTGDEEKPHTGCRRSQTPRMSQAPKTSSAHEAAPSRQRAQTLEQEASSQLGADASSGSSPATIWVLQPAAARTATCKILKARPPPHRAARGAV